MQQERPFELAPVNSNYGAAALADVPNRCAVHGANPIGEVAVVSDNDHGAPIWRSQ